MAATRKGSPLDNVLGRLDDLDPTNLTILVQRLARERRLLETVFNTIREGTLVIGRGGIIEYANAAAARLLGFSLKDVGDSYLWERVPELARTLRLTNDGDLQELAGISREVEVTYPDYRILRVYIVPFQLEDSHGDGEEAGADRYAVIVSDVTEEKDSTRKRIEHEKVSSIIHLAAGVAHELGNPLNSLTIHLALMRRQLAKIPNGAPREKLTRNLDICAREVERLDGIIRHFLEAVRPQEPNFADLDLIEVLEEALEFLGQELADAGLQVDVELEDKLPVVRGDRNQLKQVFFNVLKNAREATASGGRIRIRGRSDDAFVYVQIGDTGEGIDEQDLANVFQPYFTTKRSGTGLGMMVVQRIMQDHGGQIGIDSRKGKGTVVTLQLPQKHRRIRYLEAGSPPEAQA